MLSLMKQELNNYLEIIKTIRIAKSRVYTEKVKYETKFMLLKQWIYLYQYDHKVYHWLKKNGIKTVAIYGMSDIGQLLYYDLSGNKIDVKYVMDKNYEYMNSEVPIYPLENSLERVDIVIVTVIGANENLLKSIKQNTGSEVITLEEIIDQLTEEIEP